MKYPGGYQMVDISDVTLGEEAVTVTNAKNAEILRTTRKPVYFHGAKLGAVTVAGFATLVSDTGAVDGKVYNMVSAQGAYTVSTDDDTIIFTPVIPVDYQIIDISDVTLGEEAVTVTNAKNAEILRTTRKPIYFYGYKIDTVTVAAFATLVSDSGVADGKTYNVVTTKGVYTVNTNDDTIIFTPPTTD